MSVRMKVFAVVFWFSCAVALILIGKEDRLLQGGASVEGAAVEASVVKANEEAAGYMKHVILAFLALAPALGVCAAFIESRSSGKKNKASSGAGGKKSVPEKVSGPVFTGTLRSVSIEQKVKAKTYTS